MLILEKIFLSLGFVPFCLAPPDTRRTGAKVPKKATRRLKPPSGGESLDYAFALL
jgi:hypothetical protein